ncbi:MAG TPA: tRNA lysidine(34) synthetase TilS, partial [Pseudolabrys sp.]|nr:tRNA lysidine(34) synthetase TilS [Pseudolabrys sp.]
HKLRKESKREAGAVKKLARELGVRHVTLTWNGKKPKAGLPAAAREARYRLLSEAAKKAGATHILTAHTLDDQAETVLFRMARGSGIRGLAAMARKSQRDGMILHRPLLGIAKARLIATLRAAKIPFADDPTNRDVAFTRPRLRAMMPSLAKEGLDARRLALLAQRLRRADAALDAAADRAMADVAVPADGKSTAFDARGFQRLPAEIALRVLARVVTRLGDEGPVELGKLEALKSALDGAAKNGAKAEFRRTLAGAVVTLSDGRLTVARAPARRSRKALTTRRRGKAARGKRR